MPYWVGASSLGLLWLLYILLRSLPKQRAASPVPAKLQSGTWGWKRLNIFDLAEGADKRLSTSKFQFLLWTAVAVFSYVAVYTARAQHGIWGPIQEIPAQLLALMGISTGAMIASKAISVNHANNGGAGMATADKSRVSDLIQDDSGAPDLSKLQMVAWTLISIAVYLALLVHEIDSPTGKVGDAVKMVARLPDVDPSLLVLMGVSQGAYLGKKLVTKSTAALRSLRPSKALSGRVVEVEGDNLGDEQGGSEIVLEQVVAGGGGNGFPFTPSEIEWKKDPAKPEEPVKPKFTIPDGTAAAQYFVYFVVGGQETNRLTLTVDSPGLPVPTSPK